VRIVLNNVELCGVSLLHQALRKNAHLSEALIHRLDREQLTAWLINQRNACTSEVFKRACYVYSLGCFVMLIEERRAHVEVDFVRAVFVLALVALRRELFHETRTGFTVVAI